MKFGYTLLYVNDVEATLQFYERAFGFQQKFLTPKKDYGELISGETTLCFGSYELGNSNFRQGFQKWSKDALPMGVELIFVSETIEADFQRAEEAGAITYEPIAEKPWGQRVGYLRDLNGFLIEICTPMQN